MQILKSTDRIVSHVLFFFLFKISLYYQRHRTSFCCSNFPNFTFIFPNWFMHRIVVDDKEIKGSSGSDSTIKNDERKRLVFERKYCVCWFRWWVCRRRAVENRQPLGYHSKWQCDMAEVDLDQLHSEPEIEHENYQKRIQDNMGKCWRQTIRKTHRQTEKAFLQFQI